MRFNHAFAIAGLRPRPIEERTSVALFRHAARAANHAFFLTPLPLIFDPLSRITSFTHHALRNEHSRRR
jgi:hypothetical protein